MGKTGTTTKRTVKKKATVQSIIPSAEDTVKRITNSLKTAGDEFRETHKELAERLAALIGGAERGASIYVPNKNHEFVFNDVVRCLDGLGYVVMSAHPMVNNPYVPFTITWWTGDSKNPFLGE